MEPRKVYVWFGKTGPDGGLKYHLECLYDAFPEKTIPIFTENFPDDLTEDDLVIPFIVPTVSEMKDTTATQLLKTPATVIANMTWECPYIHYRHLTSFLRADIITFPSRFLSVLFPHRRTKVVPLPIKNYKRRKREGRSFRVGCVISAHPRKNHEGWVELVKKLKQPWKFVFVYHRWQWELLPPDFKALRNLPHVEFIEGPIPEKEMEEFYHSLDWYISLSVGEGYDLPVREALKCGVPVIVGKHTGHLDLPDSKGIIYYSTTERDGAAYELPVTTVKTPIIDEVVTILQETQPPEVEENLPLPTKEEWRKTWRELYIEARSHHIRLGSESRIVFLRPINYYCGLRAVTDVWARRLNAPSVNITDAPRIHLPPETIIFFPYFFGFLLEGKNVYPLMSLKVKHPDNPLVVWTHSVMEERELSLLVSVGAKFLATTPYIAGTLPNALILPNPMGEPARRPPESKTVVCWGLGRVHLENEMDNLIGLVSSLPNWNFVLMFTPAVTDPDPRRFVLLINHLRQRLKETGNNNYKLITHHLRDDELEEILDCGSVYLIPVAAGSLGTVSGELSARIPQVLRKGRPILCPYNPDRLGPYIVHLKPISPWNASTIHQYLTNPTMLEEMKPRGVPPIEKETDTFLEIINRLVYSKSS